jgi:phage repressor protein C with HTH and peptisase S24 domain
MLNQYLSSGNPASASNSFADIEAFEGRTRKEEQAQFYFPGMQGNNLVLQINSESMSPTLLAGDMVFCSEIHDVYTIHDGALYAVITDEAVWVKRLQRRFDEKGGITHFQLLSDNAVQYAPFAVEIDKVKRLLRVTNRMSGL